RAPGVRPQGAEPGLRADPQLRGEPRALPCRRRLGIRVPRRPGARARPAQPAGRGANGARLRPLEEIRRKTTRARESRPGAYPRRRGAVEGRGGDRRQGPRLSGSDKRAHPRRIVPAAVSLRCEMRVGALSLEAAVVDVSLGGLGTLIYDSRVRLEPG